MLRCGRYHFNLNRPLVMGIVNVTPDSFSDGGRYFDPEQAIAHGLGLRDAGADMLDIGGESTRPGSKPVPVEEELSRVLPVLNGLRDAGVALSVDTMKPEIMVAALAAGADMINDVRGFEAPGAWEAVADSSCGLCIMHMRGTPQTMQQNPTYGEVVGEVEAYLHDRIDAALARGIEAERLVIDPGFGFGKSVEHNLALMRRQRELLALGRPLLLGWSRKSTLGALTGRPVEERLAASVAAALAAVQLGARIVRVHDVAATVDALKVWGAAGLAA